MSGDHVEAGRDAYVAGGDIHIHLGNCRAVRDLDENTLARRRRVLGANHPNTQRPARNLEEDLRALGDPAPP